MELIHRNTDYALRALLHLASLGNGRTGASAELAARTNVSLPFARKLLRQLARRKIITSVRGVAGGYRLAGPPSGISVLCVLEAVQGRLAVNRCFVSQGLCARKARCPLRRRLGAIQEALRRSLARVPLSAFLRSRRGRKSAAGQSKS
ncbi:MAG: Rrf2 family transcriptional regulator [Planctomycetota bacterium]|nr:Rrf2 family transcriptional regulator [Planctomycetota bacterium]